MLYFDYVCQLDVRHLGKVFGVVVFEEGFAVGWAGSVPGFVRTACYKGAVSASDRWVGAFGAAWAGCIGPFVVVGQAILDAHSVLGICPGGV